MFLRLEHVRIIPYKNGPHTAICRHQGTYAHKHKHTHTQTLAAVRSIVFIPIWAVGTGHGSSDVDAQVFAVTATVVFQALVDVYSAQVCVSVSVCVIVCVCFTTTSFIPYHHERY